MFYISAHLKKQYDGWLEYSSDEGTIVTVWTSLVTVFGVYSKMVKKGQRQDYFSQQSILLTLPAYISHR